MYDTLAPHYRDYSAGKAPYLDAIDKIIVDRIPVEARSMLDVGAGDGIRAVKISRARQLSELVLAEPSAAMVVLCQQLPVSEVWQVAAQELPETERRFDVITCLWNVLGHVPSAPERLVALQKMRELLKPEGVLFFDVNNRYNALSYGWLQVMGRLFYDLCFPDNTKGDATFHWAIDGETITAMGHVFTPREINCLLCEAGLRVRRRYVVDYRTGQSRRFVFGGQLLYEAVLEVI